MIDVESRDVPLGGSESGGNSGRSGGRSGSGGFVARAFAADSDFQQSALKLAFCFIGLQASYLTWGYMQELIMTTVFEPTENVPSGKFPSAAFCVFSNRFLAVIVGAIACKLKHGAVYANNHAPLWSFAPCAMSNTLSSWSQYASLKYVAFPVQTVFKSSKIIPVMIMGKFLKGTSYPFGQYIEAFLITLGVAIFSLSSKTSNSESSTEIIGLIFMLMYICCDSFTSQWQDKIYQQYGRNNVDQYQMMFSVNTWAISITVAGLIVTGDFPTVVEFLTANPIALRYNIITAITSATGQLFIFYTIKEFGPIVFTIIMTTRQLFSITISCIIFNHVISWKSLLGAVLVFSVIFYQIRRKYVARMQRQGGISNTVATVVSSSPVGAANNETEQHQKKLEN
ncbi:MAG: adenosine 3'-phospho 5'-phosphosulfate transporter B2 [Bacillariaceae sp.]|jgi:adenosine 3'-phospho 5'-phosphosulfate transporter B2